VSIGKQLLSAVGKLGIVIGIACAFFLGLTGTVYLSLKSPEVKVPDIVGKDMVNAEDILYHEGLNIRRRTTKYSPDTKPNVVLDQLPRPGEVVKEGQTVAVVVSRAPLEGEAQAAAQTPPQQKENSGNTANEAKNSNDDSANANGSNRNKNKNTNKNSNSNKNANGNSNISNISNISNRNNGNTNLRNMNVRPNSNSVIIAGNRNVNSAANRNSPTLNLNRRPPTSVTSPARSNGNIRNP
jgi:PASTA domain